MSRVFQINSWQRRKRLCLYSLPCQRWMEAYRMMLLLLKMPIGVEDSSNLMSKNDQDKDGDDLPIDWSDME